MADERSKAIELALSQIEKQFGKGSIMRLGSKEAIVPISVIPTGSISFDAALGVGAAGCHAGRQSRALLALSCAPIEPGSPRCTPRTVRGDPAACVLRWDARPSAACAWEEHSRQRSTREPPARSAAAVRQAQAKRSTSKQLPV